jgi:DNA-binding helix-hairpin-helix protein with protein kinase domain
LYHVKLPQGKSWVAKIYHPNKRGAERAAKMLYLQANNPYDERQNTAWILDLLDDEAGNFVGILMPFLRGEKLEVLCSAKLPRKLKGVWHRYEREQVGALTARMKLGAQLASAVAQLHASQHYVLVDLKPDNVLVQTHQGTAALVDLDSLAVVESGKVHYPASVATPEYAPPEHYKKNKDNTLHPSWDTFSLAVILYKLLCGIHPYAATGRGRFADLNSLGEKIEQGLFVHNNQQRSHLQVIPPPHQRFFKLPESVQQLFHQCFVAGHNTPEKRPTASDWCWALLDVVNDPVLTSAFRDTMADGWEQPRIPLPLPSTTLTQHKKTPTGRTLLPLKALADSDELIQKIDGLLERRQTEPVEDERTVERVVAAFALIFLVFLIAVVENYTTAIVLCLFVLVVYLLRTAVAEYKYVKERKTRRLQQFITAYQNCK